MTDDGSRFTDVIVIGSGPAGCSAAATLVKAGFGVLIVTEEADQNILIDSTPYPLESIHPGVSSLLEKIGAEGAELKATRAHYAGIHAGNTYTPLGEDSNGPWQGMHINRKIFNRELLQRIKELGVVVRFNEKVESFIQGKAGSRGQGAGGRSKRSEDPAIDEFNVAGEHREKTQSRIIGIRTGSTELYAEYIIDASGKNAIVGKKLKFKRKFYSPPLICSTGISEISESFPFDLHASHFIPGENGWTWLAPQTPNYCAWTMLSVKGEKSLLPPDALKDYPVIGKINFANMRWRMFRPLCTEGLVLCGDAAGILDPAAGQGIFNALMSGILAGNTVVSCLKEPDFASFHLAYYDDWFVQQFEMKVKQLKQYYADNHILIHKGRME